MLNQRNADTRLEGASIGRPDPCTSGNTTQSGGGVSAMQPGSKTLRSVLAFCRSIVTVEDQVYAVPAITF